MNIASELVPVNFAGIASGFSITVGCLGVILIPPLFGLTVDYSGSYLIGWILLDLILAFVVVLLFVFYGKYRNGKYIVSYMKFVIFIFFINSQQLYKLISEIDYGTHTEEPL